VGWWLLVANPTFVVRYDFCLDIQGSVGGFKVIFEALDSCINVIASGALGDVVLGFNLIAAGACAGGCIAVSV
jgi:hypothetical protein